MEPQLGSTKFEPLHTSSSYQRTPGRASRATRNGTLDVQDAIYHTSEVNIAAQGSMKSNDLVRHGLFLYVPHLIL